MLVDGKVGNFIITECYYARLCSNGSFRPHHVLRNELCSRVLWLLLSIRQTGYFFSLRFAMKFLYHLRKQVHISITLSIRTHTSHSISELFVGEQEADMKLIVRLTGEGLSELS